MAGKSKNTKTNKNEKPDYHSRLLRRNQVIFGFVAVILILSMALAAVSLAKF